MRTIHTVYLKAYELSDEKIFPMEDVETPLILIEEVEDFKENTFWIKIRNLWVLIGKIPPLKMEEGDILLFKEDNRWGLFKYLKEEGEKIILADGKGERKTKVDKGVLKSLNFFGKVLRVQEKV